MSSYGHYTDFPSVLPSVSTAAALTGSAAVLHADLTPTFQAPTDLTPEQVPTFQAASDLATELVPTFHATSDLSAVQVPTFDSTPAPGLDILLDLPTDNFLATVANLSANEIVPGTPPFRPLSCNEHQALSPTSTIIQLRTPETTTTTQFSPVSTPTSPTIPAVDDCLTPVTTTTVPDYSSAPVVDAYIDQEESEYYLGPDVSSSANTTIDETLLLSSNDSLPVSQNCPRFDEMKAKALEKSQKHKHEDKKRKEKDEKVIKEKRHSKSKDKHRHKRDSHRHSSHKSKSAAKETPTTSRRSSLADPELDDSKHNKPSSSRQKSPDIPMDMSNASGDMFADSTSDDNITDCNQLLPDRASPDGHMSTANQTSSNDEMKRSASLPEIKDKFAIPADDPQSSMATDKAITNNSTPERIPKRSQARYRTQPFTKLEAAQLIHLLGDLNLALGHRAHLWDNPPECSKDVTRAEVDEMINHQFTAYAGIDPKYVWDYDVSKRCPDTFYNAHGILVCPAQSCRRLSAFFDTLTLVLHWNAFHVLTVPAFACKQPSCTLITVDIRRFYDHTIQGHNAASSWSSDYACQAMVIATNPVYQPCPEQLPYNMRPYHKSILQRTHFDRHLEERWEDLIWHHQLTRQTMLTVHTMSPLETTQNWPTVKQYYQLQRPRRTKRHHDDDYPHVNVTSSTTEGNASLCMPPFSNWYIVKIPRRSAKQPFHRHSITWYQLPETDTDPQGLNCFDFASQEELQRHYRLTYNDRAPPTWIVGSDLTASKKFTVERLPILPSQYSYSYDPLGRPWAYINMFDPTGTALPDPHWDRRLYAALIIPAGSKPELAWRLPGPVLAWRTNVHASYLKKGQKFDSSTGSLLIDRNKMSTLPKDCNASPEPIWHLRENDINVACRPGNYENKPSLAVHSDEDWRNILTSRIGEKAANCFLDYPPLEIRRITGPIRVDRRSQSFPHPIGDLTHLTFDSAASHPPLGATPRPQRLIRTPLIKAPRQAAKSKLCSKVCARAERVQRSKEPTHTVTSHSDEPADDVFEPPAPSIDDAKDTTTQPGFDPKPAENTAESATIVDHSGHPPSVDFVLPEQPALVVDAPTTTEPFPSAIPNGPPPGFPRCPDATCHEINAMRSLSRTNPDLMLQNQTATNVLPTHPDAEDWYFLNRARLLDEINGFRHGQISVTHFTNLMRTLLFSFRRTEGLAHQWLQDVAYCLKTDQNDHAKNLQDSMDREASLQAQCDKLLARVAELEKQIAETTSTQCTATPGYSDILPTVSTPTQDNTIHLPTATYTRLQTSARGAALASRQLKTTMDRLAAAEQENKKLRQKCDSLRSLGSTIYDTTVPLLNNIWTEHQTWCNLIHYPSSMEPPKIPSFAEFMDMAGLPRPAKDIPAAATQDAAPDDAEATD